MADRQHEKPLSALPAGQYCDASLFERESDQLFSAHWWLVGTTDSIASSGDYLTAQLGKFSVVILRNKSGELTGFHNICRHRAGPLVTESSGRCRGGLLVCRYHGWSYDLDGRLVNAHSLNDSLPREQYSLYPIRVASWNGLLFASVGKDGPDLQSWLGKIPLLAANFAATADMDFHGTIEKSGLTNWKCYGENACEGYHVGMVHKTLTTNVGRDSVSISCDPDSKLVAFDVTYSATESDPTRSGKGLWIYKFPGLLLHYSDYTFNAEVVMPISVATVSLKRWFWWLPEQGIAQGVSTDQILQSASRVMGEDLGICEQVFQNLDSGIFRDGVLSSVDEPGTVFFQSLVSGMDIS